MTTINITIASSRQVSQGTHHALMFFDIGTISWFKTLEIREGHQNIFELMFWRHKSE